MVAQLTRISVSIGSPAWAEAVDLKRHRAYTDVMATCRWTYDEVAGRYAKRWAPEDFHETMLRRAVEGGELLAWVLEGRMVAYAAVSLQPLCGEGEPLICISGDVLVVPELAFDHQVAVAEQLYEYGCERGALLCEFNVDAPFRAAMAAAGFQDRKALMRR